MVKSLCALLLVAVAVANAQFQYRPATQYRGVEDGQYHPSNEGRYVHDSGKYVHKDYKYVHVVGADGGAGGNGPAYRATPEQRFVQVAAPTAAPRRIVNVPAQPPTGWATIRFNNELAPQADNYHYLWVFFFFNHHSMDPSGKIFKYPVRIDSPVIW